MTVVDSTLLFAWGELTCPCVRIVEGAGGAWAEGAVEAAGGLEGAGAAGTVGAAGKEAWGQGWGRKHFPPC